MNGAFASAWPNTLTLHAIPAPYSRLNPAGMSWQSPGQLVRGVLVNELGKAALGFTRTLGHAGVHLQVGASGARKPTAFLGSVTFRDPRDFRTALLKDKIGLGMLFDAVPGRLETAEEMQHSIDVGRQTGRLASVQFLLSSDVASALVDYTQAFVARGVHEAYGLEAQPLRAEGAGCSAFSMAYLELAGILAPRFRGAWSFSVRAPEFDAGRPLIGGRKRPMNKVPLVRAALLRRGWAQTNEPGIEVFGWDPTRMAEWIQARCTQAQRDRSELVLTCGKAHTLVVDARDVRPDARLQSGDYFGAATLLR